MLFQNDPFADIDHLFARLHGRSAGNGTIAMPMDAYRRGENVWVHIDLPGVSADNLDVSVERNVLTVSAQRDWLREEGDTVYMGERARGVYRRQVHLGEGLDSDGIEATFNDGVVTLRIPVAEKAKPRKIDIGSGQPAIASKSS